MAINKSYTEAERLEWVSRWNSGNALYASAKTRINSNCTSLLSLTLASQYTSPYGDALQEIYWHDRTVVLEGAYEAGEPSDPVEAYKEAGKLRDAAFKRLITGETTYNAKLREFILSQITAQGTDFSNRTMWTMDSGGSSYIPMFQVSEWLYRFAKAYEYCQDLFSAGEQTSIEAYLYEGADYFRDLQDTKFADIWTDRYNDNYTPTGYTLSVHNTNVDRYNFRTHIGGKVASPPLVWRYHNRYLSSIRAVAAIGYQQNNSSLKEFSKRSFKEFIKFWAYPDGLTIEMERGFEEAKPEAGYSYNWAVSTPLLISIADMAAREGDSSLFDYTTSDGYFNTGGAPKNIWTVVRTGAKLFRSRLEPGQFYDPITQSSSIYSGIRISLGVFDNTIQASRKIDAYDPYDTFSHVPLIHLKLHYYALANCYFQDNYINESYKKSFTDVGTIAISSAGSWNNDNGAWGDSASIMIERYGMDDVLNPYGEVTTPSVSIYGVSPNTAREGDTVVINGIGFSATPASNTVTFNGVSATVQDATTTTLTVIVPTGNVTGIVSVTVGAESANYSSFTEIIDGPPPVFNAVYVGTKKRYVKSRMLC